jgi:hypothetical protein
MRSARIFRWCVPGSLANLSWQTLSLQNLLGLVRSMSEVLTVFYLVLCGGVLIALRVKISPGVCDNYRIHGHFLIVDKVLVRRAVSGGSDVFGVLVSAEKIILLMFDAVTIC